jgi:hypothetical protein
MNTMRWRYGDTCPIMVRVDSEVHIEIGDLIVERGEGRCIPANQFAPAKLDPSEWFYEFQNAFVGVAMQASRRGDIEKIRAATQGVFEFDCESQMFEVGDMIVPFYSNRTFFNQQVQKHLFARECIGRCAKRVQPANTRVLVDIVGSPLTGRQRGTGVGSVSA